MSESNNELFKFLESLRSAQENEKSFSQRSGRVKKSSLSQSSRSDDEDKDPFDEFFEDMQKSRSEDKGEDAKAEDSKVVSSDSDNIMNIVLGQVAKHILKHAAGSREESEDESVEDSACAGEEDTCEDCNDTEDPQLVLTLDGYGFLANRCTGECECEDSIEVDDELADIFGKEFVADALEEFYAAAEAGFIDADKSAEYLFARLLDSTQTESAMSLARLAYTLGQVSALDAVQDR